MPSAVGFVVIGRNEGARLELCLRSVLLISQRVSYANSASTDGSPELAEQLGVAVVRLPQDGKLNAARGRNAGYAELVRRFPECDAIQFLDGDCILQPGYLQLALNFLKDHPRAAVVCGRRFELDPGASIYNALCEQEWNTPVGQAEACGGDALIRRSAFDQVGGYNGEILAGEEPEMTARMRAAGWEIWRIDAAMTEHDARIRTFRQWWRRTQRGGLWLRPSMVLNQDPSSEALRPPTAEFDHVGCCDPNGHRARSNHHKEATHIAAVPSSVCRPDLAPRAALAGFRNTLGKCGITCSGEIPGTAGRASILPVRSVLRAIPEYKADV